MFYPSTCTASDSIYLRSLGSAVTNTSQAFSHRSGISGLTCCAGAETTPQGIPTAVRLQEEAASSSSPHPFNTSGPAAAAAGGGTAALGNPLWAHATAWAEKARCSCAGARVNAAAVAGARGVQPPKPRQRAQCMLKVLTLFYNPCALILVKPRFA